MSSTALLCYGQVAMRAGKQVLPWVDNITSRMVLLLLQQAVSSRPGLGRQGGSGSVCTCVYCACVCMRAEPANLPTSSPRVVQRLAHQVAVLMAPGKQGLVGSQF